MKQTIPDRSAKTPAPASKKPMKNAEAPAFNFPMWIAALIFIATTLIFFSEHIFGHAYFWEDFAEYVYPTQTFAAREAANGSIPFWNPYSFGGMPFLADIQVGFFYPFNRILSLFVTPAGLLPVGALQFTLIIHFFFAQLGMFLLARHLKISSISALITAFTYSFCSIIVCHVIHPMIVYHLTWLPFIFYFLYRALEESSIKFGILSGLVFGMTMLSGHPQFTLYLALFLGFYVIWHFVSLAVGKKLSEKPLAKYIPAALLPFVIALGIFQVQFMPSRELANLSIRAESTYEKSSVGSLQFRQVLTSIMPKFFGFNDASQSKDLPFYLEAPNDEGQMTEAQYYIYWETAFYFGIVGLMLGFVGIITRGKTRFGAFLWAAALFSLLYAFGSNFFLHRIFYELPFFGTFRNPVRMMFFAVFAFALLAGFGLDDLFNAAKRISMRSLIIIISVPIGLSLLASLGVLQVIMGSPESLSGPIAKSATPALLVSIFAGLIILLAKRRTFNYFVAASLLALLTFIDLYSAGSNFNKGKENFALQYQLDPQLEAMLRPNPPSQLFRVNMRMYNPSFMAMNRNQGMVDGIMLIEGYNPLVLSHFLPPVAGKDQVHDLYNVKYEIGIDSVNRAPVFIKRNTQLPRAYIVHDVKTLAGAQFDAEMKSGKYNFARTAFTYDKLPETLNDTNSYDDLVKCEKFESSRSVYSIKPAKAGLLTFSEVWYPAWKIYVDGQERQVFRTNNSFVGAFVKPGDKRVELRYESATFAAGKTITIITLLLSVVGFLALQFVPALARKSNQKEIQGS